MDDRLIMPHLGGNNQWWRERFASRDGVKASPRKRLTRPNAPNYCREMDERSRLASA